MSEKLIKGIVYLVVWIIGAYLVAGAIGWSVTIGASLMISAHLGDLASKINGE